MQRFIAPRFGNIFENLFGSEGIVNSVIVICTGLASHGSKLSNALLSDRLVTIAQVGSRSNTEEPIAEPQYALSSNILRSRRVEHFKRPSSSHTFRTINSLSSQMKMRIPRPKVDRRLRELTKNKCKKEKGDKSLTSLEPTPADVRRIGTDVGPFKCDISSVVLLTRIPAITPTLTNRTT
ncbi:unnamed protein product [Nesidiocoris tenuis]|uniref:Uncharacterized protein n=1 Tax=Nesidiocoris tenuis TaxID=355587 RepID=A0A6H5FW26_9HEMI|nr:unnamed protein product [Nesidiocoris tenuis]